MTAWWLLASLAEKQSVIHITSGTGILVFHFLVAEQPAMLLLPQLQHRTPLQAPAGPQVCTSYRLVVGSSKLFFFQNCSFVWMQSYNRNPFLLLVLATIQAAV